MSDAPKRTFRNDFKRFFFRGLVVLLPTVLTLWLVVKAYQFVDTAIAEPVNQGIRRIIAVATPKVGIEWFQQFEPAEGDVEDERLWRYEESRHRIDPDPEEVRADLRLANIENWWNGYWPLDVIGLVVAILGTYMIGKLLGGFFGRRVYGNVERLITSLPIFKQVYPHIKQIVDFLFSSDKQIQFSRVVMVQYPRKGIWSIGFVTGEPMKAIASENPDVITIFVPSSPTPFTGYTITVPRADTIELQISVDEALKFTVSGGVLVPDAQRTGLPISAGASLPAGESGRRRLPAAFPGLRALRRVRTPAPSLE